MGSVFTIGHSNHEVAAFIALLRQHRVEVLIDVRSFPVSKYSTQFNRTALKPVLSENRIKYSFLGNELGGRPAGPEFYDDQGYVLYNLVALTQAFERGIERLMSNAGRYRLAIMCSEEDPAGCHRRLLIARVLRKRGLTVGHIRSDGNVIDDAELDDETGGSARGSAQLALFDVPKETVWRSARSVLPKNPPRSSLEH
jgi:uncharacterized protein (DUF488 family)